MQLYPLPISFADETLTNVRFTPINAGTGGIPFIAAATVAAIPEPESYALMLAGLALLGFLARGRRTLNLDGSPPLSCPYEQQRG